MDQDLAIWKAVQLAEFYNHALFVPEFNSIKKRKPEDNDFFYTILDEIVDVYDNIYCPGVQFDQRSANPRTTIFSIRSSTRS